MFTTKKEYAKQYVTQLLTVKKDNLYRNLIENLVKTRDPELEELIESRLKHVKTPQNKELIQMIREDIAEQKEEMEVNKLLHTPTCFCSIA